MALQHIDPTLTDADFERVRGLVYEQCRIKLGDNKRGLVVARLGRRLRATGHGTFTSYIDYVLSRAGETEELVNLLNAISTNKTSFFREGDHFTFLQKTVLPGLESAKRGQAPPRLRLWSSACSTGEEPYTIAITVWETLRSLQGWDAKLLATDISTRVLAVGRTGIYDAETLADVPAVLRQRYFTTVSDSNRRRYQVNQELRDFVTFRRLNLCQPKFPFHGTFDVIFCRNVMIYFDKPTQCELVGKFVAALGVGGYLFIGHSESLLGMNTGLRRVCPTVYQRVR